MVKIKKCFTVVIAIFCMIFPIKAFAAELYQMQVLQARAEKPKVVAYFNFFDANNSTTNKIDISKENVEVYLDGEKLEIESFETQKESEAGVVYYYLVDNSTSVPENYFSKMKETIKNHILEKPKKDKIIVISFASGIKVVLDGNESLSEAEEAIKGMRRASGGTRLYDAIIKATNLVDKDKNVFAERSVIFVVTDGVDKVAGGNTLEEVTKCLEESNIPIYAFGYDFASKESLDSLGELARTTTGKMSVMKLANVSECIFTAVDEVQSTYRVVAFAKNNIVENGYSNIKIIAETNGESYEASIGVINNAWQKDETAPEITGVSIKDEHHFEIVFSENINGTNDVKDFEIVYEKKELTVKSVKYSVESLSCIVETEEKLYNGEYILRVKGIKDVSMEENALENGEYTFVVDDIPKDFEYFIDRYGFVFIVIGAVIGFVFLLLFIKKKKNKRDSEAENEEDIHKLGNAVVLPKIDGVKAEITVIDSNRIERRVKCVIGGAYIIGRDDDKCDLAIEDKHLSHQHMAFVYEDGILSIQDLESTNGTKVNGIKITKARKIEIGDIIEIGNTRLRIRIFPQEK